MAPSLKRPSLGCHWGESPRARPVERGVGQVGELREIGVAIAVEERRGGAGPAGPFPLGLGRQRELLARLLREPVAELHGLVPGDADHRLVRLVDRIAPLVLVLVGHADHAAVVLGVEGRILGVGDLHMPM